MNSATIMEPSTNAPTRLRCHASAFQDNVTIEKIRKGFDEG